MLDLDIIYNEDCISGMVKRTTDLDVKEVNITIKRVAEETKKA